jgi:hypothetical protein
MKCPYCKKCFSIFLIKKPKHKTYVRIRRILTKRVDSVKHKLSSLFAQAEKKFAYEFAYKTDIRKAQKILVKLIKLSIKKYGLVDPEKKAIWETELLSYLVNNPKEYRFMDKKQFSKYFEQTADFIHRKLKEREIKK